MLSMAHETETQWWKAFVRTLAVNGGVTWPPEFPNHGDGDRLPSDIVALVPSPVPLWCFLPCDLSLYIPSGLVWMVWCRGILALRLSKNRANFLSLLLFLFFSFSFSSSFSLSVHPQDSSSSVGSGSEFTGIKELDDISQEIAQLQRWFTTHIFFQSDHKIVLV